jgi:hypothetical protein
MVNVTITDELLYLIAEDGISIDKKDKHFE